MTIVQYCKFSLTGHILLKITTLKILTTMGKLHAKKVMSDILGRVDFAIGIVIFVLNLPYRQVLFFGEIHITEGLYV